MVPTDGDSLSMVEVAERDETFTPERMAAILEFLRDRLRRAKEAGVTIAAGSDNYIEFGIPQGEAARRVLFAYREAGLTVVEVLQAATVVDALLLGLEGKVGVIKPGAFADIIAVEGDPELDFRAMERVRFVMKAGRVYLRP